MKRSLNFGAGPATLPLSVLEEVREELLDFAGTGKSILETSHRSPEYDQVHQGTSKLVKELLGVGDDDVDVLFFGGGASTQFALVPMNYLGEGETADYLVTGAWSQKAVKEAKRFGQVREVSTKEGDVFTRVPTDEECGFSSSARYVHLTSNNTIFGTQYHTFPKAPVPLVADMSSDMFWRAFDPKPFGLIYAGAQKNLGPAGVTLVIVRKDFLAQAKADVPSMFNYQLQAEKGSLFNTPPAFPIYVMGKTLAWIKANGGLAGMEQRNRDKADLLYGALDASPDFFRAPVAKDSRSLMNVVFRLPTEELEKKFIAEAKTAGMIGIKGHRSVGGIRVSIYNAAEPAWVKTLVDFMGEFQRKA